MSKFVVFGGAGQLGTDLLGILENSRGYGRSDADVLDLNALVKELRETRPRFVINCAAYVQVDAAESEPDVAFAVNALGARNVAMASQEVDAELIHISTSYVFGGDSEPPYREEDLPRPVNVYGTSKLAAEHFVSAICERYKIIRTSGLYGVRGARAKGKGGNFVETMLRLAREGKPLRVVSDQRITPTYTVDLARKMTEICEADAIGIFHATNSGGPSWFDFAAEIFNLMSIEVDLTSITSSEYDSPATRPLNAVLDHVAFRSVGIKELPDWKDALGRYLKERGYL